MLFGKSPELEISAFLEEHNLHEMVGALGTKLTALLGKQLGLELLQMPDENRATLYVLVLGGPSFDAVLEERLDSFLSDYWSTQPREARGVVAIGCEYV